LAKPVVDRLERELEGQAEVIRVNVMTKLGLAIARRHSVRASPTLLVFDGKGSVIYFQPGIPNRDAVHQTIAQLAGD